MTQEHPITLLPELVDQWFDGDEYDLATKAARWGADMELEACCEWLKGTAHIGIDFELINARRPQPPSLKDEVREIIECLIEGDCINDEDAVTLRRTLEFLPN